MDFGPGKDAPARSTRHAPRRRPQGTYRSVHGETLLQPGEMLGGFRVDDVIGIGGMAIVYRAEQVSLGRQVALKVLSSKLSSDDVFRERFRREGTHAATLEHPNIVPVYDSGEEDGHLYLAMRLVDGTSLAEIIHTRGLTADETIQLLRPIASALDTAHAAGLIHRDVKPQNILVTAGGHPYLADFGVAKGSNTDGLTVTGSFVGSVNYASPEQIKGLTLTPASDVYALTAVLYHCLTGEVPYPRETDAGVMHAHLHEPPPTLPGGVRADSEFHTVLARGMAKDSGSRYGHAGDMMNAAALSVRRLPRNARESVPAFPPGPREASAKDPGKTRALVDATRIAPSASASQLAADGGEGFGPTPPPPPGAAGTDAARGRRVRWRAIAAVVAGVVIVAMVAVLLAGGTGGSNEPRPPGSARLALSPKGWSYGAERLKGLGVESPMLLSRDGIMVNSGLLQYPGVIRGTPPAALIARYGRPVEARLVHLTLGPARNYTWTDERSGPFSLYVIATSSGELALACGSPQLPTLTPVVRACTKLANGARVLGAKVEYPGADPALAKQLAAVLAARGGDSVARGLSSAKLSARAQPLETLAAADALSATVLQRSGAPARYAQLIDTLVRELTREGNALARLAQTARSGSRSSYEAQRRTLDIDAASLESPFRELAEEGFVLPGAGAIRVPAAPRAHVS